MVIKLSFYEMQFLYKKMEFDLKRAQKTNDKFTMNYINKFMSLVDKEVTDDGLDYVSIKCNEDKEYEISINRPINMGLLEQCIYSTDLIQYIILLYDYNKSMDEMKTKYDNAYKYYTSSEPLPKKPERPYKYSDYNELIPKKDHDYLLGYTIMRISDGIDNYEFDISALTDIKVSDIMDKIYASLKYEIQRDKLKELLDEEEYSETIRNRYIEIMEKNILQKLL